MSGLSDGLFGAFLDWLYQSGEIKVPSDFHSRCDFINKMVDNDSSCLVNTILDYAINSASETQYKVESENSTLEKLMNLWLDQININIDGIPTGLQQLSKEYFRERWAGSSLCLMRVSNWKTIEVDKTSITVPMVMWFVNGASVYVKRPNEKNYQLGTDKFYLDANFSNELPQKGKEDIIIQKPFSRWFDRYPTPYLVKKGVLKNYLTLKSLQEKVDEVISKVMPYLFVITKGNDELTKQGITYEDKELQDAVENFKHILEKYKIEKGRTPANMIPYDQKYDHLIPDLLPILKEDLYNELNRRILCGLGFVDVIQGISSTRKESIINPKPFITELNAGVEGFKEMLMSVVTLIINRNAEDHKKLFADGKYLEIVNEPLKINTEAILDIIRSGYDRGPISIRSFVQAMGLDYETERERRKKELADGDEELMYPHIINNQEKDISEQEINREKLFPSKARGKGISQQDAGDLESQGKKKGTPEAKNFNQASDDLVQGVMVVTCQNCKQTFTPTKEKMKVGDVRCPSCGEEQTDLDYYVRTEVSSQQLTCKNCKKQFVPKLSDMKVGHVRCDQCDKEYPNTDYMLIDFPNASPQVWAAEQYIRVRVQDPGQFDKLFTIWFSQEKGIRAIIGKKKSEAKTTVQSVLFDKDKYTEQEAKKWVEDRYGRMHAYLDFLELEEAATIGQPLDSNDIPFWKEVDLEMAPYRSNSDLPHSVQKYPAGAQDAFRKTFNKSYPKGEAYAFPVAWSALKRWLAKHGKEEK